MGFDVQCSSFKYFLPFPTSLRFVGTLRCALPEAVRASLRVGVPTRPNVDPQVSPTFKFYKESFLKVQNEQKLFVWCNDLYFT